MPFENWETDHKVSKGLVIALITIAIISIGTAYATYKIISPDSDVVTSTAPATLSKPTVNGTSIIPGETIQITTTLSDSTDNLQVFFYENNVSIGSAYTNSAGQAIYNRVVNSVGSFVYSADTIHP